MKRRVVIIMFFGLHATAITQIRVWIVEDPVKELFSVDLMGV